jgi:transcription initiation factor TFIIIB Brf1 subunit/transcription initiation factor TFIIB
MSLPFNNACVNCGDASGEFILDYSSGDYICSKCGAVQPGPVICTGRDWTEFDVSLCIMIPLTIH